MSERDFIGQIRAVERQETEIVEAANSAAEEEIERTREQAVAITAKARQLAEEEQKQALEELAAEIKKIEAEAGEDGAELTAAEKLDEAVVAVVERIVGYSVDR